MVNKLKNATVKLLHPHKILDLKSLTDENKKCFMHNRAQTTLFSKCRTVYLDIEFQNYTTIHFYDKKLVNLLMKLFYWQVRIGLLENLRA